MPDFLRIFSESFPPSDHTAVALAQWTALGVMAGVISILVTGAAVALSVRALRRQLNAAYYAEIDRLYFDLTSLLLTANGLAAKCQQRPSPTSDPQYDAYCLMVWNFIETVFDRCCDEQGRFEISGRSWERIRKVKLFATWEATIRNDGSRHLAWFQADKNQHLFKPPFREWVKSLRLASDL